MPRTGQPRVAAPPLTTAQAVGSLVKSARDIMRKDKARGNSDPQRLEAMGAVLSVTGRQCQIIVLTTALLVAGCTALPTVGTPTPMPSRGPTATPTETPEPTPRFSPPTGWPAAPFTVTWRRAESPPTDFVGTGLAATSRGFMAVGHSQSGPPFQGRLYLSVDGSRWTLVAGGDVFGDVSLNAVDEAQPSKTVIVAGTIVHPGSASALRGAVDGAVWISVDLEHWLAASTPAALSGADLRAVVALGDEGFLAEGGYQVGETLLGCPTGCVRGAGVWQSPDGRSWERILGEDDSGLQLTMSTPSMLLGGNIGLNVPTIWRAEPSGWQRTDAPPGLGGIPTAVWSTDACGQVLGASVGNVMYVSEDGGRAWRTALGPKPALSGVLRLELGYLGWNTFSDDLGLWSSTDGFNWGPIDYFGRVEGTFGVFAIAQIGAELVAFGSADDPGPFVATVSEYSEPPCLE